MKRFTMLVIVLVLLFGLSVLPERVSAQNYRTDGGLTVVEDSLLSPNRKQVVFVVAKDIPSSARVEIQTHTSEGVVNNYSPHQVPQGLTRGQIIPIWSGEFNSFNTTPWFNIWITIYTATDIYNSNTMFPVNYREQYKEPMITSISETGGYGVPYQITVRGIFDTTIPSLILINTNVFIPTKTVTQNAPGIIQFTMPSGNFELFPSSKYLLTICQAGHCDTLQGRHR